MQITVEKIMVLWYTILLHKQKTGRKEGDTVPEKSFDVARNIRMTQELQCRSGGGSVYSHAQQCLKSGTDRASGKAGN